MKPIKLKTSIKCAGCITKVTPFLNEIVGENQWHVDTLDPLKILTVMREADAAEIIKAIEKAGFKAEPA